MDANGAKNIANAFWLAAGRNLEERRLNTTQMQMLLVPGVVCMAFSIELGIKSIIMRSGTAPKTHDLAKLFAQLPEDARDRIVASCATSRNAFDQSLAAISGVFEEWRYIYESTSMASLNLAFLKAMADAVKREFDAVAP